MTEKKENKTNVADEEVTETPSPAADDSLEIPETESGKPVPEQEPDLQAEAELWRDKYLRKLAEFDNYRKRTRQEGERTRQLVIEVLITSLLPVMDDFDRMLDSDWDTDDPHCKGVELIRNKLLTFFADYGVKRIEARGKVFDPDLHDALMTRPSPDFPAGTVLEEITPGYKLGDRVIRHAQVVVSEVPEEQPEDKQENSEE